MVAKSHDDTSETFPINLVIKNNIINGLLLHSAKFFISNHIATRKRYYFLLLYKTSLKIKRHITMLII